MDPERIAAGGTSAGGHLAAMLGVASEIEALDLDASLPPPVVKLVIDFFGPSELGAMDADAATNGCPPGSLCHDCPGSPEVKLVDCRGNLSTCAAAADAASPVSYASSDDPPFVVLHGTSDCTVPFPQGERMHQALIDAGAVSSFVETPGAGHSLAQVATPQAWQTVYDAVDEHLIGCTAR
jgi:acetyl esterase/lipase